MPAQSVYVKIYTIAPLQLIGDGEVTVGVMVLPHASVTTGAAGIVASLTQFTVDDPLAGSAKSGAAMV